MTLAAKAPAVFLDRDGTLIREVGHLQRLNQVEILPRAAESIVLLREQGLKIVVVTNQSVVARGGLTEEELDQIHCELNESLARHGARWDRVYYCPHHPTEGSGRYTIACDCRKPKTGMVRRACEEMGLDPAISYVVGDKESDMELAARVGAKGIFIGAQPCHGHDGVTVVPDLWHAAQWIAGARSRARGGK